MPVSSAPTLREEGPLPRSAAPPSRERAERRRQRRDEAAIFTRLLRRTVAFPLLLLTVLAAFFGAAVLHLRAAGAWIDHADRVISKATLVQKLFLDAETGLRGYLLTGEDSFLEPYASGNAAVPGALGQLKVLVADNPPQRARVDAIEQRWGQWNLLADYRRDSFRDAATVPRSEAERSKALMDSLRTLIAETVREEATARDERVKSADQSTAWALVLGAMLSLSVGSLIAFLGRRQLMGIADRYEAALSTQRTQNERLEEQEWVGRGEVEVASAARGHGPGEPDPDETASAVLGAIAAWVGAAVGVIYVLHRQSGLLTRRGAFAAAGPEGPAFQASFAPGASWIGRVATEGRMVVLSDVPAEHVKIVSGTGESVPRHLIVAPLTADGQTLAVLELGFLQPPEPRVTEFLGTVAEAGGTAIRSSEYRAYVARLLQESQRQAEALQQGQEELRVANEELEEHARALNASNAQLEEQHAELEAANSQLEDQAQTLERQRDQLETTTARLLAQTEQLTLTNQVKTEFLANMSHELRTPLNSSLILAKLLAENKEGNLNPDQVRFAQTIHSAGNDLLALINDILDLSRIEAGQLTLHPAPLILTRLLDALRAQFLPLAAEKGLRLDLVCEASAPTTIETDGQRLQQILTNLLSNAIKFTDSGEVALTISRHGPERVAFEVRDTGIGIDEDKQTLIFEAFRQADGSTQRRYGGTGLGLAISRDLADRLGGELEVRSERGRGSTFRLLLPQRIFASVTGAPEPLPIPRRAGPPARVPPASGDGAMAAAEVREDDRDRVTAGGRSILLVEDDPRFARILTDLAHEQGFQTIVATTGAEGVELAGRFVPKAIVLDMNLPDGSGLTVLERLKGDRETRHIPVHVVSVLDFSQRARELGAVGYALKPVRREELIDAFRSLERKFEQSIGRVLIVEDVAAQRESLVQLLASESVEITAVGDATSALEELRRGTFDCMVLDLGLPDVSGYELLDRLSEDPAYSFPPVIVYTGRALSPDQEMRLRRYSSSVVIKGARSPERLLDEVTLFLHRVEATLPREQQRMLHDVRNRDSVFEGRRILLVEDDVRNIFALTSVFEPLGATVEIARHGREALEALNRASAPDASPLDLVLMDIMMPEMDGLTAIREFRKRPDGERLPIVALTAKATAEDRGLCLAAGANDYIAKPLDVDKLLSLVRVWMPR